MSETDKTVMDMLKYWVSSDYTFKEIVLQGFIFKAIILSLTFFGLVAIPLIPLFFFNVDEKMNSIPKYVATGSTFVIPAIVFIVLMYRNIAEKGFGIWRFIFSLIGFGCVALTLWFVVQLFLVPLFATKSPFQALDPFEVVEGYIDYEEPYRFWWYLISSVIISLYTGIIASIFGIIAGLLLTHIGIIIGILLIIGLIGAYGGGYYVIIIIKRD